MKPTEFSVLGPLMGGFGSQAFLGCLHAEPGTIRPAVMVFLPDTIVDNSDLFRKVWNETELGMLIDHVNVIAVMGLARLDEGYARVVEYADAESLRSVYRRATTLKKPVPSSIACAIVADAAMGVHYAHELGLSETGEALLHSGVRPETLLVSFKGMGKVTGYGATTIAEVMRKTTNAPETRDGYTSPEQSYGGRSAATVQTDVYALGCVLYEALTGKPPFPSDNDLAEAMIRDELARPTHKGISEAMTAVVLKATQKKSSERYANAFELRMDILEKCEVATEGEIRRFMDELFPADTVPRATRDQMLKAARDKPPTPTGKLLVELPVDQSSSPLRPRSSFPSDAEVEAAQGRAFSDGSGSYEHPTLPPSPPPAAFAVATQPPGGLGSRTETRDLSLPRTDTREAFEAPTRPNHDVPVKAPASSSKGAKAPQRARYPDRGPSPSYQAHRPDPAYTRSSQPPVVYRNSPALLVALGAAGALAIALVFYVVTKEDPPPPPPPQIIVQAPPPPPPPPPPAIPDDPEPPPASTKKQQRTPAIGDDPSPREPASREPVATGPGKLSITTTPATMVISVDKVAVGTGSATWEGKAGSHKVTARDAGLGAQVTKTVKVVAGETTNVSLEAEQGWLMLDRLADGLDVVVDGKAVGKTPLAKIQLYAGPHKIVVKKGGESVRLDLDIVADSERWIETTLQ